MTNVTSMNHGLGMTKERTYNYGKESTTIRFVFLWDLGDVSTVRNRICHYTRHCRS
jgi:hypothetical protein